MTFLNEMPSKTFGGESPLEMLGAKALFAQELQGTYPEKYRENRFAVRRPVFLCHFDLCTSCTIQLYFSGTDNCAQLIHLLITDN